MVARLRFAILLNSREIRADFERSFRATSTSFSSNLLAVNFDSGIQQCPLHPLPTLILALSELFLLGDAANLA
jgi:hypothetical protein